jgi:hypothetical protein
MISSNISNFYHDVSSARHPYGPPKLWHTPSYVVIPSANEDILNLFEHDQEALESTDRLSMVHGFFLILYYLPFIVSFEKRVELFRQLIQRDKLRLDMNNYYKKKKTCTLLNPANFIILFRSDISETDFFQHTDIAIRRQRLFEDGFSALFRLGMY